MKSRKPRYRYRITLDRNTLIIDRVRISRRNNGRSRPAAVVEELDAEQELIHAIVEWLQPRVVYTDNHGPGSVRLVRACARRPFAVTQPQVHRPQAKGRAERLHLLRGRGAR